MESSPHDASPDNKESSHRISRRGFLGKTAVIGSAAFASATMLGPSSDSAQVRPAAQVRPSGSSAQGRPSSQGAAGAASSTAPSDPLSQQGEMVLQLARTEAVFPIDFPSFGESGPAKGRATAPRLLAAEHRLTPKRLAQARAGADELIAQGLLGAAQSRLLAGIGRHAAQAGTKGQTSLVAVVALGVATLSHHFDPADDAVAKIWLDGLRRCHQHGQQPQPLSHRD